jgi:hypothetical protein
VINGSFERRLEAWMWPKNIARLDPGISWGGGTSLKLSADQGGGGALQYIPARSGHRYELTGFVKTALKSGEATLSLTWMNDNTTLHKLRSNQEGYANFYRHRLVGIAPTQTTLLMTSARA